MQFVSPEPWDEILDKLGDQSIVASTLTSAEWSQIPVGLRDNAFFSATIEDVRFLQAAKDWIDDFLRNSTEALENGKTALVAGSRAQFVKDMSEFAISHGLGPLDPEDEGTIKDIRSQARLSLIFNTKTQQMYSYGNWKQGQDPDLLDQFPAQRFMRIQEVKSPRIPHQLNDGAVRLKSDLQFWLSMNDPAFGGFGVPWGPWGFNSGMGEEDVDRPTTEQMGLLKPGEPVTPIDGRVNDMLQASTQGLDDTMIAHLKTVFGDQVEFTGDTVRWSGKPGAPVAPAAPAPAPAPAPEQETPETLDQILHKLGLITKPRVTADDMTRLIEELKETNPVQLDEVLGEIKGTNPHTNLNKPAIRQYMQEFLNFLPKDVARSLPDLSVEIRPISGTTEGWYSGGKVVMANKLATTDPNNIRRVLFHEMEHWLHMDGPTAFRQIIQDHFDARTAGEEIVHLPGYSRDTLGLLDKWWDAYAGRIYDWEHLKGHGYEVPTRYIEWLTKDPEQIAAKMNKDPYFRETFLIVLKGFFQ